MDEFPFTFSLLFLISFLPLLSSILDDKKSFSISWGFSVLGWISSLLICFLLNKSLFFFIVSISLSKVILLISCSKRLNLESSFIFFFIDVRLFSLLREVIL